MTRPGLRTVTRTQGNNRALKEGRVTLPGYRLDFEEVAPLPRAFRRMVRELEFDVSEMALTTYLCARAHGVKFTALPIFLVRDFHHGAVLHNRAAGLSGPKDLEGRRVGVNRGYTVTTGVWARAILQEEHGVDLGRVTWALSGDEHVANYRSPPNVEPLGGEGEMSEQLARGEITAAIGAVAEAPGVVPLIENSFEAGVAALRRDGLYPINHLMVVRDDVLEENPGLATELFDGFVESKRLYLDDLRAGRIPEPSRADKVHLAALEVMADPLPYGISPNADTLERLMRHAVSQGILERSMPLGDLFAAELQERVG